MKQFNLSEWLANPSRKVITRDGKEVALFGSLSGNKEYPVKGMIEKNETVCTWTKTGIAYCNGNPQSDDLFFADEEELTEFDYAVLSIISDHNSHTDSIESFAKRSSKKLIDLARKEIRKEEQEKLGTLEMPIDVTEPYYIKGREDALKDLPKLEKSDAVLDPTIPVMYTNVATMKTYVEYNRYKSCINDLFEKLPKEE